MLSHCSQIIIACLLPNVGCWLLSLAVYKRALSWLKTLKVPKWTPPGWLEFPVWTITYSLIGYASFLIYNEENSCSKKLALCLYSSQLMLNWAFVPIFFGCHNLKLSLIEIVILDLTALACAVSFVAINSIAGLLFIPYIIWHVIETAVTYKVYIYNKDSNFQHNILINENKSPDLLTNNK